MSDARRPLDYYLGLRYPFQVLADPDGGYVAVFPDLPGCMTQAERLEELPALVEDARRGWIEAEYAQGHDIPLPSYPEAYSGKFLVRLPRSLHRALAEAAAREGASLNQYVTALLAQTHALAEVARRLEAIEARLAALNTRLSVRLAGLPRTARLPAARGRPPARIVAA